MSSISIRPSSPPKSQQRGQIQPQSRPTFPLNEGATPLPRPYVERQNDNTDEIENHLKNLTLKQDDISYDKADELFKAGRPLPELHRPESSFKKKSEFFQYLSSSYHDLYIALRKKPEIMTEQDENGATILHHVGEIGARKDYNFSSHFSALLFDAPGVDFNIKDKHGNTPVHTAMFSCTDGTSKFFIPKFLSIAISRGFDCSKQNNDGFTILIIAALSENDHKMRYQDLSTILKILIDNKIPNLQKVLDASSRSGATAFYYSLRRKKLEEAEELLKAGTNPNLCGDNKNKDPFSQIDRRLAKYVAQKNELLKSLENSQKNKLFALPRDKATYESESNNYSSEIIKIEKKIEVIFNLKSLMCDKAATVYITPSGSPSSIEEPHKPESSFEKKSHFFTHLSQNYHDLKIALRKKPGIIIEQDETGSTILHHTARHIPGSYYRSFSFIHQLLIDAPGVDFNIKDKKGNTPVHEALFNCLDKNGKYVFPIFLSNAISRGFDCSIKNNDGLTILLIAALSNKRNRNCYKDFSKILTILIEKKIPDLQEVLDTFLCSDLTWKRLRKPFAKKKDDSWSVRAVRDFSLESEDDFTQIHKMCEAQLNKLKRQDADDNFVVSFKSKYQPGIFGGRAGRLLKTGGPFNEEIAISMARSQPYSATAKALKKMGIKF